MEDKGQIILYQTEDGQAQLDVQLQNETVWLSVEQMADLFMRDRSTIQRHIKKVYDNEELSQEATCAFFAQVQNEGLREVVRSIPFYNLDIDLSDFWWTGTLPVR